MCVCVCLFAYYTLCECGSQSAVTLSILEMCHELVIVQMCVSVCMCVSFSLSALCIYIYTVCICVCVCVCVCVSLALKENSGL